MRKTSELKFNPIKFSRIGLSGSSGKTGLSDYLHSVLSQNICYCVRESAKTVGNIADDLGVSPVYIESEIETLEEYGLLLKKGDRYIANFIIDIPSKEIMTIENEMYRRASNLFANDLYDELVSSGILSDPDIVCGQTDAPISLTESPRADDNFILWSLIPYIALHALAKSLWIRAFRLKKLRRYALTEVIIFFMHRLKCNSAISPMTMYI